MNSGGSQIFWECFYFHWPFISSSKVDKQPFLYRYWLYSFNRRRHMSKQHSYVHMDFILSLFLCHLVSILNFMPVNINCFFRVSDELSLVFATEKHKCVKNPNDLIHLGCPAQISSETHVHILCVWLVLLSVVKLAERAEPSHRNTFQCRRC